ncbi:MAG: type 1 periplasmic binding fold superfamily protein [Saprospiraceae bacterium]
MKKINLKNILVLSVFLLMIPFSCSKDPIINESELITTVYYSMHSTTSNDSVVLSFRDLDGDGGQVPTIIGGKLKSNASYNCTLLLLNESVNPIDSITLEILQEANDHQFFLTPSNSLNVTAMYNDTDTNGFPIGQKSILQTGEASQGSLTITLRHLPNKNAVGVKDGKIENADGETDIELQFDLIIE